MREVFKVEKRIRGEDSMRKIIRGRKFGIYLKVYLKVLKIGICILSLFRGVNIFYLLLMFFFKWRGYFRFNIFGFFIVVLFGR